MTRTTIAIAIAAILLCSSCSWSGMENVTGTGEVVRKTLSVDAFNSITVEGSMDVHVVKGATPSVEVVGQAELIPLLSTSVSHGVWEIRTDKSYSTDKEFAVYITADLLTSMTIAGSGNIHSADVFGSGTSTFTIGGSGDIVAEVNDKAVEAEVEGSGNITLSGTCTEFEGTIGGSGDIHAQGLSANSVNANINGSGNIDITAISELEAHVNGSGNVNYRGKPQVTSDVDGSGGVIPME
jgi:Putative auto-transporter adhesin, head GIN domain